MHLTSKKKKKIVGHDTHLLAGASVGSIWDSFGCRKRPLAPLRLRGYLTGEPACMFKKRSCPASASCLFTIIHKHSYQVFFLLRSLPILTTSTLPLTPSAIMSTSPPAMTKEPRTRTDIVNHVSSFWLPSSHSNPSSLLS